MQQVTEGESQDSAFLRRALLEAGIGAVPPCPSTTTTTTTTAVPVVPVEPPQGATYHPAPSTSGQQLPIPRTAHPPRVGWYRKLIFELTEPVVLSAEEYMTYWPYISSAYTLNKRLPETAAGTTTSHYWCRLWSPKTRKSEGKGKRAKTIRVGLGCSFKLKDIVDIATGSHTLSRHGACDSHCHTLDFLDSVKKPEALRRIAGAEVAHGYPVAVVTQTLRAPHRPNVEQAWQEAGGKFFSRQDAHNAGASYKVANPDSRFVGAEASWEEQWREAEAWLLSAPEGYRVARLTATYHVDGSPSECLLWADPRRLVTLRRRGHLALMDSTHETNWLGWPLFTIMVRDEWGSWCPAAHFLTRRQDSDVIVAALSKLREWTGGKEGWRCRWFLTDDSATEQRAVREAWPGLMEGCQETGHLLCAWHFEQTLRRRFKASHPALRHLLTVLKTRRTRPGAEASMMDAFRACGNRDKKKEAADIAYIRNRLVPILPLWAHYARCHSPLLLQVPTTNPVESWHSVLKCKGVTKDILQRFSLLGIVKHSLAVDKEYERRAEEVERKWRTRQHPLAVEFPELRVFPYPVQQLLVEEIHQGKLLVGEEEVPEPLAAAPEVDSQGGIRPPSCRCQFYQKWQLPCRHIWQHHILFGVLTPDAMDAFSFAWDEGGFEIYEGVTTEWVEKGVREAIGAPVRRRLDLREVLDGLLAKYYALEADVKEMAPDDADRVMTWWIGRLTEATGAMGTIGLNQFVQEIGWEKGKEMGDDEVSPTAWETALAELAAYGADNSIGDSEEEG